MNKIATIDTSRQAFITLKVAYVTRPKLDPVEAWDVRPAPAALPQESHRRFDARRATLNRPLMRAIERARFAAEGRMRANVVSMLRGRPPTRSSTRARPRAVRVVRASGEDAAAPPYDAPKSTIDRIAAIFASLTIFGSASPPRREAAVGPVVSVSMFSLDHYQAEVKSVAVRQADVVQRRFARASSSDEALSNLEQALRAELAGLIASSKAKLLVLERLQAAVDMIHVFPVEAPETNARFVGDWANALGLTLSDRGLLQ